MTRSTADWQALLDGAGDHTDWDHDQETQEVDIYRRGEWIESWYVPSEELIPLAASAPEAVAEVVRLRGALKDLQADMRRQPHNMLADEVADAIRIILRGAA